MFNRWQEDWSVLADPQVPREPLDELKYIPLSASDPKSYLSMGANLRERIEINDAAGFGLSGNVDDTYLLSRMEAFADLRLANQVQVFTMLESAFASNKVKLVPPDEDRLAVEMAFLAVVEPVGDGLLKLRFGRQQFSFDLQRFVSVRNGENLRQSYDAAWADYQYGPWRWIAFYSQPVQNRDESLIDDYSSPRLTLSGARAERHLSETSNLSVYYAQWRQDGATYTSVRGNEHRNILDSHLEGHVGPWDWDVEGMLQEGQLADERIRAWALGSLFGYTFGDVLWTPRLGCQVDSASGDKDPHDNALNTFNSLIPNGYYVTLAGFTGYVNLIHVKPSLTLKPSSNVKILLAGAAQWRETSADAVYTQPNVPVPNTAGRPGLYTGAYGQGRVDWQITRHYAFAFEAVHFAVGGALTAAGARDSNYVGVELGFGW